MFLDEARVEFVSGAGGSGAVSFHREKHVPRGGPNGADGGRGGSVVLVADAAKRTLYDLHLRRRIEAASGTHAVGNKAGKNAADITVRLPVGTVVFDEVLDETLVDLSVNGMSYLICKGGRGGFGNLHYVSSVRQVPNFAQKGAPGETVRARLELKLLADVGLVGLPNAGKSTLLSRISAAKPKIADYPFTTLIPNLGVVSAGEDTFVVADMPGLIEGASAGVGLGHQFLRHVERTALLVHLVDVLPVDGSDPLENFRLVEAELERYSAEVYERPRLLALSKMDLVFGDEREAVAARFADVPLPTYQISSGTGEGIDELVFAMAAALKEPRIEPSHPVLLLAENKPDEESWDVGRDENGFVLLGRRVRRMVAMTDLDSRDALRYLHRRLQGLGVIDRLREMGAQEGDTVRVGDTLFAFTDEA